jgi:6-pyruvoyltetrahydropterin/6-carboxytetrahydropterin synthase
MLTVCRSFNFCYGHFLPNYPGKCKNQHGHNSILEVEVDGCEGDFGKGYEGMILDFSILKKIVETKVIEEFDHQNINSIMECPTAENMVMWVVSQLEQTPLEGHLLRVRIYETPNSYAEWRKE